MSERQKILKDKWKIESRKHYYVKCSKCGRFSQIIKEQQGKKLLEVSLYCEHCDNEKTISGKAFSYRGINKTGSFSAIWIQEHNTIELWKLKVLPIHSSDIYIGVE